MLIDLYLTPLFFTFFMFFFSLSGKIIFSLPFRSPPKNSKSNYILINTLLPTTNFHVVPIFIVFLKNLLILFILRLQKTDCSLKFILHIQQYMAIYFRFYLCVFFLSYHTDQYLHIVDEYEFNFPFFAI